MIKSVKKRKAMAAKQANARAQLARMAQPMDVKAALSRVGVELPKHLKEKKEYHRDAIATLGISPQACEWEHLQCEYHNVKFRLCRPMSEKVITANA